MLNMQQYGVIWDDLECAVRKHCFVHWQERKTIATCSYCSSLWSIVTALDAFMRPWALCYAKKGTKND